MFDSNIVNKFSLEGKKAVVTGGAKNIGRRMAIGLAEVGADVAVVDIDLDEAKIVAKEIEKIGGSSIAVKTDVSNLVEVSRMVNEVINVFGRIDILINSAATFGRMVPVKDLTEKDWDTLMAINLKGTFLCCKEIGQVMIGQKSGKIINMASIVGVRAPRREYMTDYCVSKAGVIQLTKCLAAEWGKYNINVNSISPGYHKTDSSITELSDKSREELLSYTPLRKTAVAEDMKTVVIFLASEASHYITGHNLVSDGGRLCWYD